MTKQEFAKFVEQKNSEETTSPAINWESQKLEWLKQLAKFYAQVENYLREYIKSDKIRIKKSSVSINEPHIGRYKAEARDIVLGSDNIQLCPVGTLLIAAKGRVDMVGPTGTVKFILTGKDANGVKTSFKINEGNRSRISPPAPLIEKSQDYVWKIATPPPRVRFVELNQESFFNALTEVANG